MPLALPTYCASPALLPAMQQGVPAAGGRRSHHTRSGVQAARSASGPGLCQEGRQGELLSLSKCCQQLAFSRPKCPWDWTMQQKAGKVGLCGCFVCKLSSPSGRLVGNPGGVRVQQSAAAVAACRFATPPTSCRPFSMTKESPPTALAKCSLLLPCCHCLQVRAPTHIVSTICDDRGEEPTYCGVSMSELMEADANVGDAIG